MAMTGTYFRGDGIPVLRAEDEAKFYPITYNYYQQLNGYKYLKNLILGYHFYHGSYLDHIGEVLDTHKKTIIHIPSVNQRAATGLGKYQETADIMKVIGTLDHKDYNTGIYYITTDDGRTLKVADLVEDEQKERNMVQAYLQNIQHRDDVDIIIALGTAKEGFDWQWCEMCLTVGVRGSLTEVIQIIGRCTRDCEGKETARFVNMIAMPEAEQAEVKVAVNDFLKAIGKPYLPMSALLGVLGLGYRLVVGVALVVRPVGVAAADTRQRQLHDDSDDDGGEFGGFDTLGLALLWGGVIHGFHFSSDGFVIALFPMSLCAGTSIRPSTWM